MSEANCAGFCLWQKSRALTGKNIPLKSDNQFCLGTYEHQLIIHNLIKLSTLL